LCHSFFAFSVTGGGGNNHPVGGYVDPYQQAAGGGVKQQLLTLVRSVRTVMRGKNRLDFGR